MPERSPTRAERALVYAMLGATTEVVFTAVEAAVDRRTRDARLEGHTYLWMPPIYASLAVLFEPVHDRLRGRPWARRAVTYSAGIIAVEYITGLMLRRLTGTIPWDYTGRSRLVVSGATRLDYAPLWAAAGLALERVDDRLRGAAVVGGR